MRPQRPAAHHGLRAPRTPRQSRAVFLARQSGSGRDAAAIAIEAIATAALRMRLRSCGSVAVRIEATSFDLLAGRVESASVDGRQWESPLGLTARVLDVAVGRVELDLPAVLTQQRILLRNTPTGRARVVFSARDFGAFLVHQLVAVAARRAVAGGAFAFDREGVVIVHGREGGGCVLLTGTLPASGQRYQLTLRPSAASAGRAVDVAAVPIGSAAAAAAPVGAVRGSPPPASEAAAVAPALPESPGAAGLSAASAGGSVEQDPFVSAELSRFFSALVVDLQGAEMAFSSLRITTMDARPIGQARISANALEAEPVLELELAVTLRSFPPLNMRF